MNIKFGREESLEIGKGRHQHHPLDKTNTCNYLGMIINEKGIMEDHRKTFQNNIKYSRVESTMTSKKTPNIETGKNVYNPN